jgi:hypothetical protein
MLSLPILKIVLLYLLTTVKPHNGSNEPTESTNLTKQPIPMTSVEVLTISPGARLIKVQAVTTYETSISLTFIAETAAPTLPALQECDDMGSFVSHTSWKCQIVETLKKAHKHIEDDVFAFNIHGTFTLNSTTRPKRAAGDFYGNFLNWCCSVTTETQIRPMLLTEEELKHYVTQLQRTVTKQQADILQITSFSKTFSVDLSNVLKTMKAELQSALSSEHTANQELGSVTSCSRPTIY